MTCFHHITILSILDRASSIEELEQLLEEYHARHGR